MSLKKVGELLKQERTKLGLSIDDVMLKTKVGRNVIEAVESGETDFLPHFVYVKGFIRAYALMLGLDWTKVSRMVNEAHAELTGEEIPEDRSLYTERKPRSSGRGRGLEKTLIMLVLAGVVALLVYVWVKWQPLSLFQDDNATAEAGMEAPSPEEIPSVFPGSEAESDFSNLPTVTPTPDTPSGSDLAASNGTQDNATVDLGFDLVEDGSETNATDGSPAGNEAAFTLDTGDGHSLVITTNDDCWLGVKSDGRSMRETVLRSGDHARIDFSTRLEIRFGNPAGVVLSYDGQTFPMEGEQGKPKTLVFPPSQ